jgi:hypothetical protein
MFFNLEFLEVTKLCSQFSVASCWMCFRSSNPSATGGYADVIEQTDFEDVYSLQFMQWTVPQFCFQLLDKLVPCLGGPVDEELAVHAFELLQLMTSLLRESVSANVLWDDHSMPAREMVR